MSDFDTVFTAAEQGSFTIAGLPHPVGEGTHVAVFAWGFPGEYKVLDVVFTWDGAQAATYSIDETFFDAPYKGWMHWSSDLLVAWAGGHLTGDGGHSAALISSSTLATDRGPEDPKWWLGIFTEIMDALYGSPASIIGSDAVTGAAEDSK